MRRPFITTSYRFSHERLILAITIFVVLIVIAFTATATVCLSLVFILAIILLSYQGSQAHHQALMRNAYQVSPESSPELINIIAGSAARLQAKDLEVFVTRDNNLNAYTFGLTSPKIIVLHSALFEVMDKDELQFIIGHEMGHVCLGHTMLNTLVGGMAGIPSSYATSAILVLIFQWWNRACEYSADRAGLLSCSKPDKAISALVKLATVNRVISRIGMERALARIETEDDDILGRIGELMSTHPMTARRIEHLRRYATTNEYQRLQALVNQNLELS